MDRKDFLRTSLIGAAALAAGEMLPACRDDASRAVSASKGKAASLHLSFQEKTAPGDSLEARLDFMESLGIEGYEPGGKGLAGRIGELTAALRGRNIRISAVCAGFDGFILAEDPVVKAEFDASMRDIIAAAGELGSVGVIMVPAFNHQVPCRPHTFETRDYLCAELHELGEYALKHGTSVILEPLNRREAFYLRLVSDAAAICRDARSEGVRCMGDFWHMKEETSDYAALMAAGKKYLRHVHIASRGRRKMPGEDGVLDDYRGGFRALKEMGYDHFVGFECGTLGDRAVTATEAVRLLHAQWEQADLYG